VSDVSIWLRSATAIAMIGAVLFALQYVMRRLQRGAVWLAGRGRLLELIETLPLPNACAVHVVRIGGTTYALAGSQAHVSVICEIPPDAVPSSQTASIDR
jgi:flagellar biogenesis protein FliO